MKSVWDGLGWAVAAVVVALKLATGQTGDDVGEERPVADERPCAGQCADGEAPKSTGEAKDVAKPVDAVQDGAASGSDKEFAIGEDLFNDRQIKELYSLLSQKADPQTRKLANRIMQAFKSMNYADFLAVAKDAISCPDADVRKLTSAMVETFSNCCCMQLGQYAYLRDKWFETHAELPPVIKQDEAKELIETVWALAKDEDDDVRGLIGWSVKDFSSVILSYDAGAEMLLDIAEEKLGDLKARGEPFTEEDLEIYEVMRDKMFSTLNIGEDEDDTPMAVKSLANYELLVRFCALGYSLAPERCDATMRDVLGNFGTDIAAHYDFGDSEFAISDFEPYILDGDMRWQWDRDPSFYRGPITDEVVENAISSYNERLKDAQSAFPDSTRRQAEYIARSRWLESCAKERYGETPEADAWFADELSFLKKTMEEEIREEAEKKARGDAEPTDEKPDGK